MSYELRSPLTNIIGFVHLLGDPSTGPLATKQREYLDYITVSTNTLLALINNILDLATIDAGRMQLNLGPVDIREAMAAAAEGVQDRLVSAGLVLEMQTATEIGSFIADERRLRQILFNLLANAVSFSPPGGTVTLLAERRADGLIFAVTDHGPGIPPEVLEKVFDWFETHSLGSHHRGTGIGLSLVRSFVELHGGTVEIASVVGQGTTGDVHVPDRRGSQTDRGLGNKRVKGPGMSFYQNFDLTNEFNILRLICGLFLPPHLYAKGGNLEFTYKIYEDFRCIRRRRGFSPV